ncbi:MAG: hypothetical protein HFJ80_05345 [Clostridiales bacterium]|nr:hypothetical protein [Clostridiales bacterium]
MGAGIRRLLATAAMLCLTASLTGCLSRLPDPSAERGGSTAGEGSTAATEASPTELIEPGTDPKSLCDLVSRAAKNTPHGWEMNAQTDVQVSMRGDWGGMGYRWQGPLMTDATGSRNRYYYERNYTFWSDSNSRYHYQDSSWRWTEYSDGFQRYENNNGDKIRERIEYADIAHITQGIAPLAFSYWWLVETAEVEGSGGAYLVKMTLDPETSAGSLHYLIDELGDPGERMEFLSMKLEFLIRPEGYLKSQMITVTARGRQTFGAPEDLCPQEEVEYTAIYATTYAPKEEKPAIVPPSDLETYREADDDTV